ncbi:MAG: phosphoadenosine phosphosulfate reductase family protein [Fusobacteriaceae bacterium]
MTENELKMLQSLPLEIKILKTEQRIKEWISEFGLDGVYVSYSGGKDSEVLVDICRKIYKDIKIVFINTGVELPGTVEQVNKRRKQGYNIDVVIPKKKFKDIIEEYGYPVVSKEQSGYINQARTTKSEYLKNLRINGNKNGRFKISKKWLYLLESDFKISDKCCHWLKKEPVRRYEKQTKRLPLIGVMAHESSLRKKDYIKNGCNNFTSNNPKSNPLGFWLEKDIWDYIELFKLEISKEYIENGCTRTGCCGCLFGQNIEYKKTGTHNILKLEKNYPKIYEYYINVLGYKKVLKALNLPLSSKEK